jgi:hypothetical protein
VASFDFNSEADVDCQNKPQINAKIDHQLVANCTRHNDKAIALTFTAKGANPNRTTFMLNSIEPPPPPLALAPGLLYSDLTPGKCYGVVSNTPGTCGGKGKLIGYAVASGPACDTPLLIGVTPGKNAGWIVTQPGFAGGQTKPFGCSISAPDASQKSVQLYVITASPNPNEIGIVTDGPTKFSGITTAGAGFTYWPPS